MSAYLAIQKVFTVRAKRYLALGLLSALMMAARWPILRYFDGELTADEGFLWYGVQRTLLGEVPIRDFMAYDLGRYYWSAAVMGLMGDNGIMALRLTTSIFAGLGLFLALVLIARSRLEDDILVMISAAVILTLWMFTPYKIFDITTSIALVGVLACLIERPSRRLCFISGLVLGLAAVFGRNHGLYGVIGSLGVIVCLAVFNHGRLTLLSALGWWAAGIMVGYMPMVLALAFVPGLAGAFWEGVRSIFERQFTNMPPVPVPWPWRPPIGVRSLMIGTLYIALPLLGVAGVIYVIYARFKDEVIPPAAAAAAFLILPYAHHAFARADVEHLAQAIFPFLIGILAILAASSRKVRIPVIALLLCVSLVVMLPEHLTWDGLSKGEAVEVRVGRDRIKTMPATAQFIALLRSLAMEYCSDGRTFLAVPFWPGAYAILERKAPIWEIYGLFPKNSTFQEREIQRIEDAEPGFVMVWNAACDGREELRFQNTHPLIDKYISQNFEQIFDDRKGFRIYRTRKVTQ
jgi:hypothetical protein